jgi:hypothetical protein
MTVPPGNGIEDPEGLSQRGRRALGLIAVAIVVVVAASIDYLHPTLTSKRKMPAPPANSGLVAMSGDVISFDL